MREGEWKTSPPDLHTLKKPSPYMVKLLTVQLLVDMISNQETKQMLSLLADVSDNQKLIISPSIFVVNVIENLNFARIYWEIILST